MRGPFFGIVAGKLRSAPRCFAVLFLISTALTAVGRVISPFLGAVVFDIVISARHAQGVKMAAIGIAVFRCGNLGTRDAHRCPGIDLAVKFIKRFTFATAAAKFIYGQRLGRRAPLLMIRIIAVDDARFAIWPYLAGITPFIELVMWLHFVAQATLPMGGSYFRLKCNPLPGSNAPGPFVLCATLAAI